MAGLGKETVKLISPGQNGRYFAHVIFKCVFVNEKFCILIKISLFVPKVPIDNNPALIQMMAWRLIGDKPLSEPMLTPIHWCIYVSLGGDELKGSIDNPWKCLYVVTNMPAMEGDMLFWCQVFYCLVLFSYYKFSDYFLRLTFGKDQGNHLYPLLQHVIYSIWLYRGFWLTHKYKYILIHWGLVAPYSSTDLDQHWLT